MWKVKGTVSLIWTQAWRHTKRKITCHIWWQFNQHQIWRSKKDSRIRRKPCYSYNFKLSAQKVARKLRSLNRDIEFFFFFSKSGVGDSAQWLRALDSFQRTHVWFPALTWIRIIINNYSSRKSSTCFWALWVVSEHVIHRHRCKQNTDTQKIKCKHKIWN